jgi:outer membrane lipoprotein-sorting protein
MRPAIIVGLSLPLVGTVPAQTPPDLKAVLLKKVSEICNAATQYEFIGEATCRGGLRNTAQSAQLLVAYTAPDKYRIMTVSPCPRPGVAMNQPIIVFDGSLIWTYYPQVNLYDSLPISALEPDAERHLSYLRPDTVDHETMSSDRDAAGSSTDFIRDETIGIRGTKTGCYVVRVTPKDNSLAQTWWIDKATYHVVRIDDTEMSVVFTAVSLNDPLPDKLFRFTPPPGAKKMERDK